jgi:dTDP-3-amino-2,3,6-trideoxy-4-keto-D-glucose/dTDP-3-amino-3,4,6-trideoxy-alpha-D-glucose/dTDP-2,6-dideoxy-D-kanosamine transaminase
VTPTKVRYSPLGDQFADPEAVFTALRALVASGDFTLGKVVGQFERDFAAMVGTRHAIGVGSGTDAIKVALRAVHVGQGDHVITTANTFWATAGAICETGATPIFIDCDERFQMDVAQLEAAITPQTKAIVPVHIAGDIGDMPAIMAIARRHGLPVIEDACQSLMASFDGQAAGTFGDAAAFSFHPLKIINVWGDAGAVVTNTDPVATRCRLLRNHGLRNRDEMEILGYNTRLDSVQAVVGSWILPQTPHIVANRRRNAAYLDAGLKDIPGVTLPPRDPRAISSWLLYMFSAERRDALLAWLLARGIEAKVHYPIPLYRQQALLHLGYAAGSFPVTDRHAQCLITLPVDQHLSTDALDIMIQAIAEFYGSTP